MIKGPSGAKNRSRKGWSQSLYYAYCYECFIHVGKKELKAPRSSIDPTLQRVLPSLCTMCANPGFSHNWLSDFPLVNLIYISLPSC